MIRKFIAMINGRERPLHDRHFLMLTSLAIIGVAITIIIDIIIGENIVEIAMLSLTAIMSPILTFIFYKADKLKIAAMIFAIFIMYVLLPTVFIFGGGIFGGVPLWLVFGFLYLGLTIAGRTRTVLIVLHALNTIALYIIQYLFPDMIYKHTNDIMYLDSIASVIIVGLLIYVMVLFQNKMFIAENEASEERKHEIEELNRAQNRFFSNMSHEIRTPINTIIGLNEMILREEISDEVAEDARSIQGASNMLLTLINDVLDLSKIESGKMEIVPAVYDVAEMLSDLVNMIWSRAREKGLEFRVDVDPEMPGKLFGDQVRIKQILINLLNNAVKYTEKGSVMLSVQCRAKEGGMVEVTYTVEDTGIGIKKESIPYIFDAFKRVEGSNTHYIEGTGLGLAIVKQLVNFMGGEISVNSIYTKGSAFVVKFDQGLSDDTLIGSVDFEKHRSSRERERYQQSFEAPHAHILIVDDNASNLMVETKLLRSTKVKIDTASGGEEALEKTLKRRYDCIFMDHLMPGMDGIECMIEIRRQNGGLNKTTPTVALTANSGSEMKDAYRKAGFDDFLVKPVIGAQLENMLLKYLPRELITVLDNEADHAAMTSALFRKNRGKIPVIISTDSVCDLSPDITDSLGIPVLPYHVITEGGVFLDGIETDNDGIIHFMENDRKMRPHSDAPGVSDYEKFFAAQLTKAQYVVHITMTDKASDGYKNALNACSVFDNVKVIDSGHLSSGLGLLVHYAHNLAHCDLSLSEIVARTERARDLANTSFIMDTTHYLARSGRLGNRTDVFCTTFMLHPVMVLKKGNMKVGGIIVGSRHNSRMRYIASAFSKRSDIDRSVLYIVHVNSTPAELEEISAEVRKYVDFEKIVYQRASSAISINCGPGTFGLIYMRNERQEN